jgi:type IV pilus assembly protein PilX
MKRQLSSRGSRGAALVVALVMLIVVTLVGVTAARVALSDERAARASRDRDLAFQAAEAALRDAMTDIDSGVRASLFNNTIGFEPDCANTALPADSTAAATNPRGLCVPSAATASRQVWQDVDFAARGVPYGTFTNRTWDASVVPAPVYIVETVPHNCGGCEVSGPNTPQQSKPVAFRITALGYGPSRNIEVALQSYYVKVP